MIELKSLRKLYGTTLGLPGRAPIAALDGVTATIERGSSVGLIGLNGAGKSTLLRVLLGYARPTGGSAAIDGLSPRAYVEREGVAYVPEHVTVPGGWTVRSALRAYAMLGNLDATAWDQVEAALQRLGIEDLADRRVRTLSKGNLQRLALAQALLGRRQLMVLDEPTDGLDPVWIAELRKILQEWREAEPGRTLVIASHNLPEVERIADRVLVLHEGRLAGEIDPGAASETLETRFLALLSALPGVSA